MACNPSWATLFTKRTQRASSLVSRSPTKTVEPWSFFLRHWMNERQLAASMGQKNAGVDIAEDLVVKLFQNLISPFGNQVPFSISRAKGRERDGCRRTYRSWDWSWYVFAWHGFSACSWRTRLPRRRPHHLGTGSSVDGEKSQLSECFDPKLRVTIAKKTREELDLTNLRGRFTGTSGGSRQGVQKQVKHLFKKTVKK